MNENIFEHHFNNIEIKSIQNSLIYIVDNFYKYPEEILNIIKTNKPNIHKEHEKNSFNQIHFYDHRHFLQFEGLENIIKTIEEITKHKYYRFPHNFWTNMTKWNDCSFNDYKNNFWWPHKDFGYTGLIYLNKEECDGTNLYEENPIEREKMNLTSEHQKPWRNKKEWRLIHSIPQKFNRLVLFDGLKFTHGLAMNENHYLNDYRLNQVMFFKKL
jgi:hypothetical protein